MIIKTEWQLCLNVDGLKVYVTADEARDLKSQIEGALAALEPAPAVQPSPNIQRKVMSSLLCEASD